MKTKSSPWTIQRRSIRCQALCWAFCFQVLAATAWAGTTDIQILEPTGDTIVIGRQEVLVALSSELQASLVRIDFFVDGQALGTRIAPPFQIAFQGPSSPRAHLIQAVALDRAGKRYEASVTTRTLSIDMSIDVEEQVVPVFITDKKNRFLQDLQTSDLQVFEGEKPLPLRDLWITSWSLDVAILLDISSSMDERFPAALNVLEHVQKSLEPERDRVLISAFLSSPNLNEDFQPPAPQVFRKAEKIRISHEGFTGIYDSAAELLQQKFSAPRSGVSPVLLVLTDGMDTVSEWRASKVGRLAREKGIVIAVVAIREPDDTTEALLPSQERLAHRRMSVWADATGGRSFFTSTGKDLQSDLQDFLRDLRNRYILSFDPMSAPESLSGLKIEATRKHTRVWMPPGFSPES